MNFELTDEQSMLRAASRDLLDDHAPLSAVRAAADDPHAPAVDGRVWRLGAELGWTGLAIAERHGGSGQGLVELALVAEELGRHLARGPWLPTVVVARAVERGGDEALRSAVLPALADGSARAAWAFAEHGTPWVPEALGTTAQPDAGGYVLDGTKTVVQDAEGARWLLVTALAPEGLTSFLVDGDAPGVGLRRQRTLDASRTFAEVRLADVRVPVGRRLSGGAGDVRRLLDEAGVLLAAEALGVMSRMLEMTVDYVTVRAQFGRPIGSFQAVKHKCATMAVHVQGARAATYHAAMSADAEHRETGTADARTSLAAAVAGAQTAVALDHVAGESLQLHGGVGFTWEHDLHLYLRRAKVDSVLHGDAAAHQERVCDLVAAGATTPSPTPAAVAGPASPRDTAAV
jgi:alkylation response protein AidB-like acyl-CoA dehydrogenase